MNIQALNDAIAAVCPIDGISIGWPSDKSTWRIDYASGATDAQKMKARELLTGWVEPVSPRVAFGKRLAQALSDLGKLDAFDTAVTASKKPADRMYWLSAYERAIPEDSPKLARLAAAAGVAVAALFDKAAP